ncbi:unnamed protein product [Xylocopa violacea]|uniref:Peptidase S1 domain-containing protein n=1 Tax=Xylocopa violacea TaxID=135666 RepID=A0ABP1NCA2_XYLVO
MFRLLFTLFFACMLRNYVLAQDNRIVFDNNNGNNNGNSGMSCRCVMGNCPSTNPQIDVRIVNTAPNCATGQVYCCSENLVDQSCGIRKIPETSHPEGQASYGAYPWQVVLLATNNAFAGSGVLISPNHVLTVAHKVSSYTNGGLKVRLGDWNAASTTESYPTLEYSVKRLSIHPQFNSNNLQNDVAVITLNDTVPISSSPNINTACLPTGVPAARTRCWVSGWGKDAFGPNGRYQSTMREVDVPIIDESTCENELKQTRLGQYFTLNKSSFVCAGGEQGKDACTGDGGSPLVCQSANGLWQVIGMVAWGIGCATSNVPGVYVNVYNYISWITQQMTQK